LALKSRETIVTLSANASDAHIADVLIEHEVNGLAPSLVADSEKNLYLSVDDTNEETSVGGTLFWKAIQSDCQAILDGIETWKRQLWVGAQPFQNVWREIKTNGRWSFWIDWYEKVLNGQPQDWDLLQAIVDADIDWSGAPNEVNGAIQQVEREYLRDTVKRLKDDISQVITASGTLPNRGHNNPPELIETDEEAKSEITFIWADLDDAGRELDKDQPDPSMLNRIGLALLNGTTKVLSYIGKKADVFIDASLKGAGLTGSAWLVTQFPTVLEAIQKAGGAILEFAARLAQGAGLS